MKLLSIGLLSLTLTLNAFSAETKLCQIITDIDSEETALLLETDSKGDLDTIRLYTTMDSKVISDESHPAQSAITDGIVASEREGREVVILRPKNFTAAKGGIFVLDFLFSGISGSRKELNLKLSKVAGKFVLSTSEGTRVNHLSFIGNKFLGKLIGIKEIRTSFK
jgi:hypothetical protein